MSLFDLGQTLATPGALQALEESGEDATNFLARHAAGDWGRVTADDAQANEDALKSGARLLSVYRTSKGVKIWIVTEAEGEDGKREATTIILPMEY